MRRLVKSDFIGFGLGECNAKRWQVYDAHIPRNLLKSPYSKYTNNVGLEEVVLNYKLHNLLVA